MAGRADQVKVARVAIGRLETRAAFAEVDLAGDAGADHPLQRAVDGRAADADRFAADEIEQIISADMPFLTQKDFQDAIAFGRALAAGRTKRGEVGEGTVHGNWLIG